MKGNKEVSKPEKEKGNANGKTRSKKVEEPIKKMSASKSKEKKEGSRGKPKKK